MGARRGRGRHEKGERAARTPGRAVRRRLAATVAACLALSACATRPGIITEDGTPAWPGYVEIFDVNPAIPEFAQSIDAAFATGYPVRDSDGDGRSDYTILAISGGGALGAFGAGVLVGWTERGDRPEFDVVTGVSTGALSGALAFLGPEYDPVLRETYTEIERTDVFRFDPLGVFSKAIGNNEPLRRNVRAVVDAAFVDRVAAEHARGRRFFVATTDLDRSRLVVWDMGALAASDEPARVEIFEEVLIASAAVPVLFPPVFVPTVDGGYAMHVDGGVKAPILLRQHMFDTLRARRGRRTAITVDVIVNDKIELDSTREPVGANVPSIGANAIGSLAEAILYRTLVQDYIRTRRAGAAFSLAFIPDDVEVDVDALAFEPEAMRRLFEIGRRGVLEGTLWTDEPPFLEDLERID